MWQNLSSNELWRFFQNPSVRKHHQTYFPTRKSSFIIIIRWRIYHWNKQQWSLCLFSLSHSFTVPRFKWKCRWMSWGSNSMADHGLFVKYSKIIGVETLYSCVSFTSRILDGGDNTIRSDMFQEFTTVSLHADGFSF